MPELPEVETVCIGLNQFTLGRQVQNGEVLLARTVAYPELPADFLSGIAGAAFIKWQRHGKYLLVGLTNHSYLGVHLRMTGRLLWCDRTVPVHKHTRVRLFLDENKELRFDDQRTFGQMWWIPPGVAPEVVITGLQRLGKEPFDPDFSPDYLATKLQMSTRPLKNILLDQSVVAGIGNIYADEALFLSRIHPKQPASQLACDRVQALHAAILKVLSDGIAYGGTTFSNFQDIAGDRGNYIHSAWVFRRTGQPCKVCGTTIERIKLAGRSSHFCPSCQPY